MKIHSICVFGIKRIRVFYLLVFLYNMFFVFEVKSYALSNAYIENKSSTKSFSDNINSSLPKSITPENTTINSANIRIIHDILQLPKAVQSMRERIISAAKSGNLENLQPLLKENGKTTDLYVGQDSRDTNPIAILKELSSDTDGLEIMAILIDVLSTSLVQINAGSADEIYIWPYFAYKSIKELTASEKVDLLRLITAGDFSDMLELGEYSFYRVGIKPDGKWEFLKVGN